MRVLEILLHIHEVIGLSNEMEFILSVYLQINEMIKIHDSRRRFLGHDHARVFDAAKRIQGNRYIFYEKKEDHRTARFKIIINMRLLFFIFIRLFLLFQ